MKKVKTEEQFDYPTYKTRSRSAVGDVFFPNGSNIQKAIV